MFFMKPPVLLTNVGRLPGHLRLEVGCAQAVVVEEFHVPAPTVDDFRASPPAGFESRSFAPQGRVPAEQLREYELFSMQMARWVGLAPVKPGAATILSIPIAVESKRPFVATLLYTYRAIVLQRTTMHLVREERFQSDFPGVLTLSEG